MFVVALLSHAYKSYQQRFFQNASKCIYVCVFFMEKVVGRRNNFLIAMAARSSATARQECLQPLEPPKIPTVPCPCLGTQDFSVVQQALPLWGITNFFQVHSPWFSSWGRALLGTWFRWLSKFQARAIFWKLVRLMVRQNVPQWTFPSLGDATRCSKGFDSSTGTNPLSSYLRWRVAGGDFQLRVDDIHVCFFTWLAKTGRIHQNAEQVVSLPKGIRYIWSPATKLENHGVSSRNSMRRG